jgi:hypothetical protein
MMVIIKSTINIGHQYSVMAGLSRTISTLFRRLFMRQNRIETCEIVKLSDYSYDRAIRLGLVGQLSPAEKEEFKKEVQKQLDLAPGQDCDAICGAMGEDEFRQFVEYVKEALLRKKRRLAQGELVAAIYA